MENGSAGSLAPRQARASPFAICELPFVFRNLVFSSPIGQSARRSPAAPKAICPALPHHLFRRLTQMRRRILGRQRRQSVLVGYGGQTAGAWSRRLLGGQRLLTGLGAGPT